ncbi:MAG: cytochrome-c peroxidase [Flavobacteriaceae bacterium]|nr:MAG: cytochrome-c peroxidase [Flavobacteriaceae bacterium]
MEVANTHFDILPNFKENPENSLSKDKISLGKKLYFEKKLSKDNTQSCNTCHNLETFGVDNQSFSKGNNGGLGGRNSPSTLNAAMHMAQFWDGREPDVEAQAGGPILNPAEMEMPSKEAVEERLKKDPAYPALFAKAFPENPVVSYENLQKAIGAFERTLLTPTKFDDFLNGDIHALNESEQQGLKTFIEIGCINCHNTATIGGNSYQKFGVLSPYWEATKSKKQDLGRYEVTKSEADKYVFKVPSLRNVEKTGPYFHDGSVQDLSTAVQIMAKVQLGKDLTPEQNTNIIAFLKTLTAQKVEF